MPFVKGQSGNPAGRPRTNPLPESATSAGTTELPPPPKVEPAQTATAVIDRSLIDAPHEVTANKKPVRSIIPLPSYAMFRCYLGHATYAPQIIKSVACLNCNAKAMPVAGTAICLCSHSKDRHKTYCLDCGKMQADRMDERDDGTVAVCPSFSLSA